MTFMPNAAATRLMTDRQIGEALDRYCGRLFLAMVFAPALVGGLALAGFAGTVLAGGPAWWALAVPCVCAPVMLAGIALNRYLAEATLRLDCDEQQDDDEMAMLRRIKLLVADALTAYACGFGDRAPVSRDLARLQTLLSRLEHARDADRNAAPCAP